MLSEILIAAALVLFEIIMYSLHVRLRWMILVGVLCLVAGIAVNEHARAWFKSVWRRRQRRKDLLVIECVGRGEIIQGARINVGERIGLPQKQARQLLLSGNWALASELDQSPRLLPRTTTDKVIEPVEPTRLTEMKRLIDEAIHKARLIPPDPRAGDFAEASSGAWLVHKKVPEFLDRAFLLPKSREYREFVDAERTKRGKSYLMGEVCIAYLERVKKMMRAEDLDERFMLPRSLDEFDDASWPMNQR